MNPNRVVAVLTPLVFAPLAGGVAAWLAEHFPGVQVDPDSLQQIFIAGALIALAPAAQWLHGWQKYEARRAELERELVLANAAAQTPAAGAAEPADDYEDLSALDELDELERLTDVDDLDDDPLDEDEPILAGG